MERNLSQQTSDAKLAFQIQSQRLEEAKNNLIVERIKRPLDERKIKEHENIIRTIKAEIEQVKKLNESLDQQKVDARKKQKNVEVWIHAQKEIAGKLKVESKSLLQALKSAQAVNLRILQLSGQFHSLKKDTGKEMDLTGSSSGFYSLQTIVEILESEVSGSGRKMFHFTNQFLV